MILDRFVFFLIGLFAWNGKFRIYCFFFLPKWVSLCSYLVPFLDCCWFIKFMDLIKTRLRDIKIVKTKYKCQKIYTILICDSILKMSCVAGFPYCSPHGLKSTISLEGRESFRHNLFNPLLHQFFFLFFIIHLFQPTTP